MNADRKQYEKDPQKYAAKARRWASDNPDRALELSRGSNARRRQYRLTHYQNNKLKNQAYSREWYAENRDRALAACKVWAQENRDRCRAYSRNRRARFRAADGHHCADDILRILFSQSSKCAACRSSVAEGYHVDHINPLIDGGSNWPSNLQILCPRCNMQKNRRDPIEFMQSKGFLI